MSKRQLLHSIDYIRFLRSKVESSSGDEELDLIWKSILRKVSRRRKIFPEISKESAESMSTEKQRLVLYDGIRRMHSELAMLIMASMDVLEQEEWLQSTMYTLDGAMYLAESAVLEDNSDESTKETEVPLGDKAQVIAEKIIGAFHIHLETGTIALLSVDAVKKFIIDGLAGKKVSPQDLSYRNNLLSSGNRKLKNWIP